MDGKTPLHARGKAVVTAMTAKSMHYLGCAVVEKETNEIPVTRELFERLDLDGRLVSLDAAHTCMETAQGPVLKHGANYLLTLKGNRRTVKENIDRLFDGPVSGENKKTLKNS